MRGLVCAVACVALCAVAGSVQAGPLDTLSAGLTYVQPFDRDEGGFAALTVTTSISNNGAVI